MLNTVAISTRFTSATGTKTKVTISTSKFRLPEKHRHHKQDRSVTILEVCSKKNFLVGEAASKSNL